MRISGGVWRAGEFFWDGPESGSSALLGGDDLGGRQNAITPPVQQIVEPPDIAGNTSTTATLTIGGSETGALQVFGDDDWFAVQLVAGQSYVFTLTPGALSPMQDPYLEIYNSAGSLIGFDDDGGVGTNSILRWTATESGTFYINARAWEEGGTSPSYSGTGSYTITGALGAPQNPLDTINLGFAAPLHIDVYFSVGTETQSFGPPGNQTSVTSLRSWTAAEIAQAMAALQVYSSYTNLTFAQTATQGSAEWVLTLGDLESGTLGWFATYNGVGYGAFAPDGTGWSTAPGGGLNQGGLGWVTLIHEFGHGLGLAHPHDNGGVSEVMQGVTGPFNSVGSFALNQGVYTTMTYNDGWVSQFGGGQTGYGSQGTPMALDLALLQQRYGANATANAGDTFYVLPTANQAGTFFSAIWDTSGNDTIVQTGSVGATIDLRAATIQNAVGGGGWVSFVTSINGGYTIANGVVIENATGSTGADTLTGNSAANTLTGNGNNDVLRGGAGNDTLIGGAGVDQMFGEDGDDVIFWDFVDSEANVQGGAGTDTFAFTSGSAPTTFNLVAQGFEAAEGRFTDTGSNPWATRTDAYDTLWRLDVSTTVNDNGTREITDYDQANTVGWSSFVTRQDALSRTTETILTYDDGVRDITNYDADSSVFWTSFVTRQDALARTTETLLIHDDGTRDTTNFDGDNTQFWTSFVTRRDALARTTESLLIHDDGVRDTTNYDADNSQFWTSFVTRRDALARTTESLLIHDDGVRDTTNYDADNSQFWTSFVTRRDALGRQTESLLIHDDGTRDTTNFDPENAVFWSSFVTRRDNLGRTADTLLIYDDGRRDSTDYDEANVHDWANVLYRYDSGGILQQTVITYDDGRIEII
ncbi:MAG: M10 family metallopeptidase C-terminal domain-containing protein [Hyphomonadaceae bacterium]|nr:M10 family metallopeptidase C-terminal domain-containing protein [Hyphomonadaceae bacterium]